MMIRFISIQLLVAWICLTSASVHLKVGLYNEIPDLQCDKLASYKSMIEQGFNKENLKVNAVVNKEDYSPYGGKDKLKKYLDGDFDLIEIDTATLATIQDHIMDISEVVEMPGDTLDTAKSAVQVGDKYFGYPTLACGNFIIALSPSNEQSCPLRKSRNDYTNFKSTIEKCKSNLIPCFGTYERIVGGKMNDASGSYLPFLYLDAYIDIHDKESINKAVEDLKNKIVDQSVCVQLKWFINLCAHGNDPIVNKCYQRDVTGSYVKDKYNVIQDIKNEKTMFFFGFSEITAKVMRDADVTPYSATSWPLGPSNYMLQFTDALVVSKVAWVEADEEKQNAIREFVKYFTGPGLRRKIALGEDLSPPRNRYLLQANEEFYESVDDDPIYQDLFWQLQRSVAAPSFDTKSVQELLQKDCIEKKIKDEL